MDILNANFYVIPEIHKIYITNLIKLINQKKSSLIFDIELKFEFKKS